MANPILDPLAEDVTNATTVMASAETLVNGIGGIVADAIQHALDNGATAEQLARFNDLDAALKTQSASLAAAVEANTPSA